MFLDKHSALLLEQETTGRGACGYQIKYISSSIWEMNEAEENK
ncbi:MAG: hypothetical protein QXF04_04095 [Candidatus Aenigmatarchaeota archaeon]